MAADTSLQCTTKESSKAQLNSETHPVLPNDEDGDIQIKGDEASSSSSALQTTSNIEVESENEARIVQKEDNESSIDTDGIHENENENTSKESDNESTTTPPPPPPPLLKSTRLKGYLTLFSLSSIAFVSAYESDLEHNFLNGDIFVIPINGTILDGGTVQNVIPAGKAGRYYALTATGLSAVFSFLVVCIHFLDAKWLLGRTRLTHIFAPKSQIELSLLLFLALWWIIATWILTSIGGVAGDGKGQYNLYFSTWICCLTTLNMLERWLVAAGYSSVMESLAGWPNRAPGWIIIFIAAMSNLLCLIDIFLNHEELPEVEAAYLVEKYESIRTWQWAFLLFTCSLSVVFSFGFTVIELFRRDDQQQQQQQQHDTTINIKSAQETVLEGVCLVTLVIFWVPTLVFATTENGAASEIGNTYFATWGTAVMVIQTFIFWLRDWREGIHQIILRQDQEYKESQARVGRMTDDEVIGSFVDDDAYEFSSAVDDEANVDIEDIETDDEGTFHFAHEEEKSEEYDSDNDESRFRQVRGKLKL